MSRLEAINMVALRARLEHALRLGLAHEGSLYLLVLCCAFLSCDERSVGELQMLESVYYSQAEAEDVDGDELLTAVLLVEVVS